MNVSRSDQVRWKNWVFSSSVAALLTAACGSGQAPAKVAQAPSNFVFAPRVGQVFRHEMKHLDEFTVSAGSFREAQEWRILWEVRVDQEGAYYLYHRRLVEFELNVNGQPLLTGNEITAQNAEIVQVMDRYGRARDVTGTEQLTEAIASLVPEAQRAMVSQQFSPTNLRELLMERAVDVFDDVVGKPADIGASWPAREAPGLLQRKDVRVDSALACGATECRKLVRSYAIDQQKLAEVARRRVARFVAQQKWDPNALQVVDSNVNAEDSFVVEPTTCHFHDALLTEQGRVVLQGPAGGLAEVLLRSRDSSHAEYAPLQ
ncbi:MAG TPA: hypothetical protein VNN80_12825 [Polyangiaceae bacterium]|nr:hypothetical protein [Polyangiaceae bacterium]